MGKFVSILLVCITGSFFAATGQVHAAAPCDDVPQLQQRHAQLKRQLQALEQARPFMEQFEQVKRAIDVLHETLQQTRGDVKNTREKIQEVLGEVREQNTQLRNVRRWARGVYSNPEWEPGQTTPGQSQPSLSKGLQKGEEWIEQLEKDVGRFAALLATLEDAVRAREGRPSEQLEAFHRYFTGMTQSLGRVAEKVPLVNVMFEVFKQYAEGIRLIAVSVKRIEAEYDRRDEILRQLGPEFNNVRYNWARSTPSERLAREKQQLERAIQDLERRLRECGADTGPVASRPPEDELGTEIRRARVAAARRCAPQFGVGSESELQERHNQLLQALRKHYPRPREVPPGYGASLSVYEEIDWARKRHERWRVERLNPLRAEVQKLEREVDMIEQRFQQYRRREVRLTTAEAERLNLDRQEKGRRLQQRRALLTELERSAGERAQALQAVAQAAEQRRAYEACLRRWVEDVAQRRQWDMFWVKRANPDLYR
jgi:chromosome segregation ATPase